jgi:hypothetical protein
VSSLRRTIACGSVAIVATAAFGAAATLGVFSHNISAGSSVVARCDLNHSITVDYIGDPGPVTGLVVSDLDSACNGGQVSATVSRSDGTAAVSSTVAGTASGGAATVNFPTSIPPEDVQRYFVAVVTP